MHRPAAFAALLGLTRAASAIGDYWVNAAKAVFTFLRVSLAAGNPRSAPVRGSARVSRLRTSMSRRKVHSCV
ncbi:hypothetical protein ACIRFH_30835 [Streptomyces sp. NPDC093586]|uniref:hypothetical protein n=1 Tax=Streptomyces sp. NPDC093586 TaxID=3366042 RepID=UPI00381FA5DB